MIEQIPNSGELPTVEEVRLRLEAGETDFLVPARELYRKLVGALTDMQHAVNDVVPADDSIWRTLFVDIQQQKETLEVILRTHDPAFFEE